MRSDEATLTSAQAGVFESRGGGGDKGGAEGSSESEAVRGCSVARRERLRRTRPLARELVVWILMKVSRARSDTENGGLGALTSTRYRAIFFFQLRKPNPPASLPTVGHSKPDHGRPSRRRLGRRGQATGSSMRPAGIGLVARARPQLSTLSSGKRTAAATMHTAPVQKLHGRAFYESIGSPRFIVAPMVNQSEFVRHRPT